MPAVTRLKVKNGLKNFVPQSINFSQLKKEAYYNNKDGKETEFDCGDDGFAIEKEEQSVDYERLVLQILYNLETQEKLIFMFQLFRDYGYQIDHGSFATALHISRMKYMKMLKMVKIKTLLLVEGKSILKNAQISTK